MGRPGSLVRHVLGVDQVTSFAVLPNGPNSDIFGQNGPNIVLFTTSKYYLEVINNKKSLRQSNSVLLKSWMNKSASDHDEY